MEVTLLWKIKEIRKYGLLGYDMGIGEELVMCDQELIFLSSMILYQRASWLPLSLSSPDAVLRSIRSFGPCKPSSHIVLEPRVAYFFNRQGT